MKKWTVDSDHKYDRKMKIKQGSKKDMALDKKRKVMDRDRKRAIKSKAKGRA